MSDPDAPVVEGANALDAALTESMSEGDSSPDLDASEAVQVGEQADDLGDADERFDPDVDAPVGDDHKFLWQINGQDVELTESEVREGWLRQADYTRKTQEVASERERLKQADLIYRNLQANPAEVLELLRSELLGDDSVDDTPPNPYEMKLAEVDAFISEQRELQAQAEVEAEVQSVRTEFGQDVNRDELIQFALDRRVPSLRDAFLLRHAENVRGQEERARGAAKRTAPPVAGGSRAVGATGPAPLPARPSLRDAFDASLQELSS